MSRWFDGLKWAETQCQQGNVEMVHAMAESMNNNATWFIVGALEYLEHRQRLESTNPTDPKSPASNPGTK